MTQDELSRELRAFVGWQRSHIAAIEAGNRESIEFDTVVALAAALDVQLTELVAGEGPVRLNRDADFTRKGFREIASKPRNRWTEAVTLTDRAARAFIRHFPGDTVPFQADAELAQRLGVQPEDVTTAAERLWGRTLHQERDCRAAAMGEMSVAERRARRGHITRQLAAEIEPHIAARKEQQ